jgi:hypothetical protein
MSSMMELMFPSAPPQSGADRSHYGGALESTACYQHGDQTALNRGQGHVGRTLQAGNKDRAIKLPSPVSLTISVKKLGQRVAMKDESRNRCGTIHSVPVVCMLRHAISAYARNVTSGLGTASGKRLTKSWRRASTRSISSRNAPFTL